MTEQEIDKASTFEAARARLVALAYRMLGSRAEAEDVVQDVWLKWHLADTADIRTPAAWLTTIAARLAIDRLRHLQLERNARAAGWLPEPWLDDVAPSAEELALRSAQMSYGVMLLLERLKPDERAAFVLHEAFDCDYAEIACILERTSAACRQIVHRAKTRLQREGAPLQRPDPARHAQLVERLRTALDAQDRAGLLRLFSDAPEVRSDAPARVAEPVLAAANWVDTVTSLRSETSGAVNASGATVFATHAELLMLNGAVGIALLNEGEITALLDVSTRGGRIVALRIITRAAQLQAARRRFGLAAVVRLLDAIRADPRNNPNRPAVQFAPAPRTSSITVCGHFPVDVDA
ncbi:sigma-70 family RNA polymerase sigma factor [Paraburkholderia sp. BCC1885]|uniref:sigma-70 family RNA polymerase sigma factor n=1 Tax=Paraburkholderia sp. BCC1885 TaxID=2562669 RepID=UPI00118431B4|nr:sigma-70 family RNA polymerase sigma factor [Paraburkholderia sp. BCC1885]